MGKVGEVTSGVRRQPMILFLAAGIAGVTCDRAGWLPAILWGLIAIASLLGWFALYKRAKPVASAILLLVAVISTSGLWHHLRWRVFPTDELGLAADSVGNPVCFRATARANSRCRTAGDGDQLSTMPPEDESRFLIEFEQVRDRESWQDTSGFAVLSVRGRVESVRYGDRIQVFATLTSPPVPLNPGETSSADHERTYRRLCRVHASRPECVQILERGSCLHAAYWMHWLKDRFSQHLQVYVRGPRAGLASAILLGTRDEVQPDRNEDFMKTGTIHLLAISGLNVGILAYGLWIAGRLGFLSRPLTLAGGVAFVAWYAVLTDAEPPVVRAAVLVSVTCFAKLFGRESLNFNTLSAAGIVIVMLNPATVFLIGTQLSFLAVATMSCIPYLTGSRERPEDPLDRLVAATRSPLQRWARFAGQSIWRSVVLSTVIWLVSLPLVFYRFHVISPVAVLINPIVCLPMAIALFAGFGVMVFGWFLPPAAAFCGWICDLSLGAMEWSIEQALRIPGNHFWGPSLPGWWVATFYVVLLAFFHLPTRWRSARWIWASMVLWMAISCLWIFGPDWRGNRRHDRLTCTFVAVGHGTSVLLELPDGRNMLYDAGRLGHSYTGIRPISSVLWSRGITHLDALVISHADADHFNAVPDLLQRFSVGCVYVSPTMFQGRQPAVAELKRALEHHQLDVRIVARGDLFQTSREYSIAVLHPPLNGLRGSDNSNSIVLSVQFAGHRLLLPGDLESPGTELLLGRMEGNCDVLMAPHHGSARSSPVEFARWSTPTTVVISGARGRESPLVRRTFESQGARVLHTAYDGAVQVTFGAEGIEVQPFRDPHAKKIGKKMGRKI